MAHYVRPVLNKSTPQLVWYAVPESARLECNSAKYSPYKYGVAVWAVYRKWSNGRYVGESTPVRYSIRDFWRKFESSLNRKQLTYLIAPVASDMLTLSKFWILVQNKRYKIDIPKPSQDATSKDAKRKYRQRGNRLVMHGSPDIITFTFRRMRCKALSLANFIQTDWKDLARSIGYKMASVYESDDKVAWLEYDPSDICNIMYRWLEDAIEDWKARNIGPWKDTAGENALSLYKSAFVTHKLLVHDNETALTLEESGLYGGRATAFYLGEVGDRYAIRDTASPLPKPSEFQMSDTRIHKLDVSSMYPTLLRDKEFPVRLRNIMYDVSPADIKHLSEFYGLIGSCLLEPIHPEYPHRHKDSVIYPYGRFLSTLAGPELTTACGAGEVKSIPVLALYEMKPAFKEWAEYVLDARIECKLNNNSAGELWWKTIANSFGGKFAQRKRYWKYCHKSIPPIEWGEYLVAIDGTDEIKRMRAIAGDAYELVVGGIGNRLPAAVYVYLCSYGRYKMRLIRNELGHENVLSMDTDGLYVTDAGLDRAYSGGVTTVSSPGLLRHVSSHTYARFYDARHYCLDGEWVLAGIRTGFRVTSPSVIKERVTANPCRSGARMLPTAITDTTREVFIDGLVDKTPVDEKGWAVAPIIRELPPMPED